MKTNTSTLFGDSLGRFLAKGGTSEGAKLGWETRRGGASAGEPKELDPKWRARADLEEREVSRIEGRIMENDTPKLRVERVIHEAAREAALRGREVTEADIRGKLATYRGTQEERHRGEYLEIYDRHFAPGRKPEGTKEPSQGKPEPPKKPEGEKEPPKAEEKPKEPGKPKALTTWDVKNEGNSIASKLRGLKVKREDGSGVGNIKVMSVTEEDGGISIEMYAEGLKVGGPDDDDGNDSRAEDTLFNEGQKIVQEKFPNHDVSTIGSEKGYFGFHIAPKKNTLSKAGTSEGAKLGWESRRGGAAAEEPKAESPKEDPKKMMENLAGEAQDETHGYFGPGTGRNAALDEDVGEALQALGVKPKEAKEFLYSSMGRHLADSISTLKPGEGKEEIRQRAERHLNSHRKWATGASPKPLRLPLEPFKLPLRSVSETRKTNPIGPHVLGLDKMEFEEDEHPRDASGKFAPAGEASGKPAGEEKPKEPKPEKPLSPAKMKDTLNEKGVYADKISGKDGKYKAYFGFFYRRSGESSQTKADKIQAALPEAKIIHHEEHYAPFRGGSPVERQQHWMVEFEYAPKPEKKT